MWLLAAVGIRGQLGRTNPVPPCSSELLAKLRRGQKRIDQFGPLVIVSIIKESSRLLAGRHTTGQVQIDTAKKLRVITARGWLQFRRRQSRVDVPVDCLSNLLRFVLLLRRQQRIGLLSHAIGKRRHTGGNPLTQDAFFLGRQFVLAFRHFIVRDSLPENALFDAARFDSRTGFASFEHRGHRAQIELALFLESAMTTHALLRKNRQHVTFQQRIGCGSDP